MKDLSYFIDRIVSLESFWYANYYLRCMKKAPHGGVEYVTCPNFFLKHRSSATWHLFKHYNGEVPAFLANLISDVTDIWSECEVDIEELLYLCFDSDFWYAGHRILKPKEQYAKYSSLIWTVIGNHLRFEDYFDISNSMEGIFYAFVCYLIQENFLTINSLDDIIIHERIDRDFDKYGLTDITYADFGRQGFTVEDKYYLYNIFLDTSIGHPFSTTPLTIEILNQLPEVRIRMRCDEHLSILKDHKITTDTYDSELFRGIKLVFADIEDIVYGKESIVHYAPHSMDKLLLTVKRDDENGTTFFHIEIEELWGPDKINNNDGIILLNYIHAKYFPNKQAFTHIDFSVNQYKQAEYIIKHSDTVNDQEININKYSDIHYKIWCVEGDSISVESWSALVSATLDFPFRKLFYEMFPDKYVDDALK